MWGNDKSGSDAVGCLAEALLWSFSWLIFDCCFVMMEPLQL